MPTDTTTVVVVVVVVAPMKPESIQMDEDGANPLISHEDIRLDALDEFNKPRIRRAIILKALQSNSHGGISFLFETPPPRPAGRSGHSFLPTLYSTVHTYGLLTFLTTAWSRWEALGEERRDPFSCLNVSLGKQEEEKIAANSPTIPPLILSSSPLAREAFQQPSSNVMGQMGYYCTDSCTPITKLLLEELTWDSTIIQTAVDKAMDGASVYALPTHPGHHAATDSFGGYCYLNQAAFAARLFQSKYDLNKVAVLDVDYHCGNGTASIFYDDPSVLVVSLHCDPDFDYPFHSGFSDQIGLGSGEGTTLHLPMPPKTSWQEYQESLKVGLERITEFGAEAVVVSLGLDTHEGDPCTARRAGFSLCTHDYRSMGQEMGRVLSDLPLLFIQEGGYRMDTIGEAVTNLMSGFHEDCLNVYS